MTWRRCAATSWRSWSSCGAANIYRCEAGGQVAPQDLHIAAEKLAGHDGQLPPGRVEELHVGPPGLAAEDLLANAHALQHAQLGPALEVDGLAARAQCGGALDHGDLEAVAIQPVGQGRTGDARAGDQNRLGAHGDSQMPLIASSGRSLAYAGRSFASSSSAEML
jgi:hypothetical protein